MQMSQTGGNGQRHHHHNVHINRMIGQILKQRSILMEIGDQPQLGPSTIIYFNKLQLFSISVIYL